MLVQTTGANVLLYHNILLLLYIRTYTFNIAYVGIHATHGERDAAPRPSIKAERVSTDVYYNYYTRRIPSARRTRRRRPSS